ncbi:cytosolic sulfotransferase 17-like [Aristolochia californica]|uniref:cytosolic sulfotransferase 17-like n=1 Tax=Aristolochia californica TaxID=171875 RepID=UPI0035DCD955
MSSLSLPRKTGLNLTHPYSVLVHPTHPRTTPFYIPISSPWVGFGETHPQPETQWCYEMQRLEEETCIDHLPRVVSCGAALFQWKGSWMFDELFKAAMAMRNHFEPHPNDVILTSFPKTGTTWLKALIYTILHHDMPPEVSPGSVSAAAADPLVSQNPHELVPVFEFQIYPGNLHLLDQAPSHRIFQTHFAYELLPESIKRSSCKIVYVARNPADTVVSLWQFSNRRSHGANVSFKEAFDAFCEGTVAYGPFLDHVLGYWKERKRVLFIMYEELKEDPYKHVTRLAKFLGRNLSEEQVTNIIWRCSLERLRNVKANRGREDIHWSGYPYEAFFRRGSVGDWKNHLTEEMIQRLMGLTLKKLEGSRLQFKWEMETTTTTTTATDERRKN